MIDNKMKYTFAVEIIPEFKRLLARFGISGSLIQLNQIFEKNNDMDRPKNIKKLTTHKYENFRLWSFNFIKLLLTKIAAAGVAGNQ